MRVLSSTGKQPVLNLPVGLVFVWWRAREDGAREDVARGDHGGGTTGAFLRHPTIGT